MTRKLTPDQAECLNENLETLQDTIILLESEIEHKNTQINQRERELFEQKQLIDFDRSQFEEHARTAEQVTKNLEYRIEEKAEKERKLQRELHRVEQLLSNIKIKYNIDADEIFMSVPSSPANAQANNTTVLMVEQANTTMNASIAADNNRDKNKDNISNTNNSGTYKIRMPSYKSGGDIETFINRYEQFCETQNIAEDQKAKLILSALDDITFTVIIRELNETERKEYKKVREHLLKRFDVLKEKGQRRLQLRQAKRKIGQDLQSFYTDILSLAAKAYPGPHTKEQAQIADDAIMDQLIYGCEDEKMRLFLLEKNPKSSREALSLATSYQSAMRYNDTIRDLTITQTSVDAITSRNDANERNNYRHRQTYNNYGNNYNNSRYRQSNENEFNNTNRNNNMFSDRRTTQINEYQPYMINKGHGRYNSHLNRSYSVNPGQNRPQANPFYVNRDNNYHARKGRLQSRGMHRSNSYNNGWENRNNFSGFNRNMQNHVHWDNQVVGNQNIDAENFEDAIAHVQEVEIEQIQHTNEALNEQLTDTDSIKQNFASDTQNTQNEYSAQHIHTNTEEQRTTKPAYYLSGKIGQGEVLMLCDTGSAVSLIDESIWDNIKDQVNKLNEVKYAVRSANRHSLEILGQTDIQFQLVTKKGIWIDFTYEFMIARGLSKPAILGVNFFHAHKALINLQNNVVYLHKRGIKTTHELVGCTSYNSTTGVFVNKTLTKAPRTILRTLCNVDENINEGQQLTFEPNRQIDMLIAASVDIVRDRQIMVEFTNASDNIMTIKEDTLVGVADKSEGHESCIAETEEFVYCAIKSSIMFNSSENLANYFGPARICGARGQHAAYIALPDIPECNIKDEMRAPGLIEVVKITPYFTQIFSDLIEAYACEIEKSQITTFYSFFGTKSILDRTLEYLPYDLQACKIETNRIMGKNTRLKEIAHDIWSNATNTWEPQYMWCCKNIVYTRYRLRIRKIMIRSTAYPTEMCNMHGDHCLLKMATMVWLNNKDHYCDVHPGKTVLGERKWHLHMKIYEIVSDEGQLAITGTVDTEKHCGHDLHPTNEGIYIKIHKMHDSPERTDSNHKEIHTTSKHALLAYVITRQEQLTTKLFTQNWLSICLIQRQRYQMLKYYMASQNAAYLAARILLQTDHVYAFPAGKLLQVHECASINEYYWQPTEHCYNTIPIRFNGKHEGYLVPETNDIKLIDANSDCKNAMHRYLFTTNKDLYVWTGNKLKTTHVNYHTLEMVKHIPEIKALQLLPSHIDDPTADAIDVLGDISTSLTNSILTILRSSGADIVAFDPATIRDAAIKTAEMVENTVKTVVSGISPFLRWLNIIILSAIAMLVIGIAIFILIRIKNQMDKKKTDEMIENMLNITKTRHAKTTASAEELNSIREDYDLPLPPPPPDMTIVL